MAKFTPDAFSHVAQFGTTKDVTNKYTGATISAFVPSYKLHYTTNKRTLTQQYLLVGTRLDNSVVIVTRHDNRNATAQLVKLDDGVTYSVNECSPDDSNDYIRYDYLTLKKVTSGGGVDNG